MSGKQHKREAKRQRELARAAARRKARQQTIFTGIVIGIIVVLGGGLIAYSIFESRRAESIAAAEASESAVKASEAAASEAAAAASQLAERPVACGAERPVAAASEPADESATESPQTYQRADQVLDEDTDYGAVIETSCGTITVDLLEAEAPQTVNSFVFLAQEGFFDGLEIFRNATSIGALQTGSGSNDAAFDIGYKLPDELAAAEDGGYPPGTLAMANAGPNTGGSQFFFVYNDNFSLEPQYTVFGRADRGGVRVLREIGRIPTLDPDDPANETPGEAIFIESVEITTDP